MPYIVPCRVYKAPFSGPDIALLAPLIAPHRVYFLPLPTPNIILSIPILTPYRVYITPIPGSNIILPAPVVVPHRVYFLLPSHTLNTPFNTRYCTPSGALCSHSRPRYHLFSSIYNTLSGTPFPLLTPQYYLSAPCDSTPSGCGLGSFGRILDNFTWLNIACHGYLLTIIWLISVMPCARFAPALATGRGHLAHFARAGRLVPGGVMLSSGAWPPSK